jgi:aryl-alcohol dehydrogenase-like predicted oxidoreductase
MAIVLKPERQLGATGVKVPLIGYGTAPLGKSHVSRGHAVRCLEHAIDRGITYLDTSPDYGSEPHVGEVMRTRRSEVFLATKINRRSRNGVLDELKKSLERLQTDYIDLVQVHAVNAWADLEQALAPDGAVRALEEARALGMVRFIGITGHARPEILGHALTLYPFDTVLAALGVADRLISSPETFVLPRAIERGTGMVAMKVLGHGTFSSRQAALRYSLGLAGVSLAIIGLANTHEVDEIVEHASAFQPLSESELQALIGEVRPLIEKDAKESQKGKSDLFWLHDTNVMGWKEEDEPSIVRY